MPDAELLPVGTKAGALALPLDVVTEPTKEWTSTLLSRCESLPAVITTEADAKAWADALNQSAKGFKAINDRRLEFAREYDKAKDERVNAPAKPWLDKLKALQDRAKAILSDHAAKVEAERQRVLAEQEAERAKAQQLAAEAEARKEAAAQAVENAKTGGEFDQAAAAFDVAVAKDLEATEMLVSASSAPVPTAPKLRGVSAGWDVEILTTDLDKLPATYHLPDLKKIKAHIMDGTLDEKTPGLTFRKFPKVRATGR